MKRPRFARHLRFALSVLLALTGTNLAKDALLGQSGRQPGPHIVAGVDCSQMLALGIDKQTNLRAAAIRIGCGTEPAGQAGPAWPDVVPRLTGPYVNVDVITGLETFPHVTQSESTVWSSDGNTIVVNYNDSTAAPSSFSGVSVSTDAGATFTRLLPSPFATGHGTNYGDPILVYNQNLSTWFAGDLATGCGGQGIGLWTSFDGSNWTPGACAHIGGNDDRESMWVDNSPTSPFYGRMYVSLNNFNVGGGALYVTSSDDGVTWSPVQLFSTFIRDVQVTGGPDGTVFVAAMNEFGGGTNPRQNVMFQSGDGGATWTSVTMGSPFMAPGDSTCAGNPYFRQILPIWRFMGWGQPAVGPGGVVHYVYAAGRPGDSGDIYYTQSQDNGLTWSMPAMLNTDAPAGLNAQWMPSLSVTSDGAVLATWYDRRNTTDGMNYEVWGRRSPDNGATWLDDETISDQLIPQPEQPDPNVVGCYAGDYNYATAFGATHYSTWTDGRNQVAGHFQQDVEFAAVPAATPSGFSFLADPGGLTIPPGGSDVSTITVTSTGGFSAPVDLACSGQPDGFTCDFSVTPVTPPPNDSATSTLTVSVDPSVADGGYDFNVTGTSGSQTQTAPFHVDVVTFGSGPARRGIVRRTSSQGGSSLK